jgi:hypothetical protein
MPVGGHVDPNSIVGDSLVWKNAQKNETKNKISDTINRIILHRRPFATVANATVATCPDMSCQ